MHIVLRVSIHHLKGLISTLLLTFYQTFRMCSLLLINQPTRHINPIETYNSKYNLYFLKKKKIKINKICFHLLLNYHVRIGNIETDAKKVK